MPTTRIADLITHSDNVWSRLEQRFEGMTDEEYAWEPAPGCWSITRRPDGTWTDEFVLPAPEPAPFTTIAWRMWHLTDMYGENRAPTFLGVEPQGPAVGVDDPDGAPAPVAAEALGLLRQAHTRWRAHLALVTDDDLADLIGTTGGSFAGSTKGAFVLHMLDEFVHHGAEIALLRDLWRWQHPISTDELTERVIRGDVGVTAELSRVDAATATSLLDTAASYARWDLVRCMVDLDVSVSSTGRSPLHHAAIAGELEVVQALVEAGADVDQRDPEFDATPRQWADFLGHGATAAWLESRSATG